jgi:hypothetical protein
MYVDNSQSVPWSTPSIEQPAALAADRLGDQDAQPGQPGRVELVKLHALQRHSLTEHNAPPGRPYGRPGVRESVQSQPGTTSTAQAASGPIATTRALYLRICL